jgi:hypothetical protein
MRYKPLFGNRAYSGRPSRGWLSVAGFGTAIGIVFRHYMINSRLRLDFGLSIMPKTSCRA